MVNTIDPKPRGTDRAKNPVAVLAKHFVRDHKERCHLLTAHTRKPTRMCLAADLCTFIRHKTADRSADHFSPYWLMMPFALPLIAVAGGNADLVQKRNKSASVRSKCSIQRNRSGATAQISIFFNAWIIPLNAAWVTVLPFTLSVGAFFIVRYKK